MTKMRWYLTQTQSLLRSLLRDTKSQEPDHGTSARILFTDFTISAKLAESAEPDKSAKLAKYAEPAKAAKPDDGER